MNLSCMLQCSCTSECDIYQERATCADVTANMTSCYGYSQQCHRNAHISTEPLSFSSALLKLSSMNGLYRIVWSKVSSGHTMGGARCSVRR